MNVIDKVDMNKVNVNWTDVNHSNWVQANGIDKALHKNKFDRVLSSGGVNQKCEKSDLCENGSHVKRSDRLVWRGSHVGNIQV